MHRRLLEILVDPVTGTELSLVDDPGDEWIETGELLSASGLRYEIRGGIPRFVDEGYSESFGLQWNRFAETQLDSQTGASYTKTRFDAETGWTQNDLAGQWVVDAGCGSGRFAEIAASYDAEVIAIDLSSAVDAAAANLRARSNVHIIQADLTALPIRSDSVTFLYSIGVLQHTPAPLVSLKYLVEFLPAGAQFCFTIYARRRWTFLYSKYLLRPFTSKMPPEALLRRIQRVMPIAFPVTAALYSLPGRFGRFFQFVIPVANYPNQRALPKAVQYDQAVLDTFDMLSPRHDHPVTAAEVIEAVGGLCHDLTFQSEVPVVVRGRRAPLVEPG